MCQLSRRLRCWIVEHGYSELDLSQFRSTFEREKENDWVESIESRKSGWTCCKTCCKCVTELYQRSEMIFLESLLSTIEASVIFLRQLELYVVKIDSSLKSKTINSKVNQDKLVQIFCTRKWGPSKSTSCMLLLSFYVNFDVTFFDSIFSLMMMSKCKPFLWFNVTAFGVTVLSHFIWWLREKELSWIYSQFIRLLRDIDQTRSTSDFLHP